ncbi:hypothetical protein EAG_04013, partial [Camponotus floridanus]
IKMIQINLNRSWGALDLLRQHIAEFDVGLAIISKPPRRLAGNNTCFLSSDGLAAVLLRPESSGSLKCRCLGRGEGFIAVRIGVISVISCYVSPNVPICTFRHFLHGL